MKAVVAATLVAELAIAAAGCSSAQKAAARDPMRCERDPACSRARASYADCTRQCVDDPECVRLCEEVQKQTDNLGH